MAKQVNHRSPLAVAYAQAVLALASQQGQAEAVGQELRALRQVVEAEPAFGQFMADPAIGHEERRQVLARVFGGQVSPLVHNLMGVLSARGAGGLLGQVAAAYDELLDEQLGKVDVDLTVAQALGDEQLAAVTRRIGAALKKTAVVRQRVDDAIIGGMVLQVKDRLIDASVKTQLRAIRDQMVAARPK